MKKEITVTVAALSFIASAVGVTAYTTDDDYVCGTAGQCPLVMNFSEEFDADYIQNHKIESITFCVDCKTNLTDDRAYLTQGIIYYYSDSNSESRSFADLVCVDDEDYSLVQHQNSVCTEITVGTSERPLNLDIDKDVTIEWTWITPEKLSMYEISVTTDDGMNYIMTYDNDFYVVEIAEKMEESKPQIKSDNEYMFPIKGDYCITSVYGWDNDRWHDALDIVPYSDLNAYSSCDGTVVYAGVNGGYGNYVSVLSDDGEHRFCYGHLDSINVEYGQRVSKGDVLGVIGNTGNSTGRHLDFSCMLNEEEVNIAEIINVTNDYGDYPAITDTVIEYNELAVKCLSINKYFESGSLGANAIRPNDSGAVAIGMCQWNGCNARDMLKYLYENNKNTFINIAHKYNDGYVDYLDKNDKWWSNHIISTGDNEYNFYTELLDNDSMIELQYEYAIDYMKRIIEDAHENNITDERALLIFSRCYNVLPYGGVAEKMRNGCNSYESACEILLADTNTNRHDEIIEFVNSDFELVTVDSLKGER